MENSFTLGKKSKFGEIDFSKLKSGITKQELGIEEGSVLASIFDSIDENKEGDSLGKLDRQELNKFIEIVKKLAGKNTNLSTREAKKYNLGDDKLGKNKKELLLFIGKLSKLTQNVNNINVKENSEVITYEDGHTEEVFPDGSKIITVKDGNKTVETKKDKDGNITEENITDDNKTEHILYDAGSGKPKKKTIIAQDTESVTIYSNGSEIKTTTTNKKTGEVQEFEYVDGKAQLKKQTIPYENGSKVVLYENGAPKREITTSKENNGTRKSDTIYDGKNLIEEVSVDEKPRYQRKVIDGKEYKVSYDENGNTTGVIVQYGESINDIAEKFGVTPEELVRANAKLLAGGKRNFSVGDEIVIPRKMDADEYTKAQEGRLDKESAIQQFKAEVARKKAEAERRELERQAKFGEEIVKGQNGYFVTKKDGNLHYWNSNKKEISAEEFKKYCPSIYENVTRQQKGVTKRIHDKYDTTTIKQQAGALAKKIHEQISGASVNANTINLLRGITPENAAFVISEYQRMFGVSLAKDIDDEWGLDLNTIKEHVCTKLVDQAKSLGIQGIYYGDYQKINDLDSLQKWINNASAKIINTMSNAKETYYATDAEETQRQQSKELQRTAKTEAEQIVNDLIKETSGYNDVDKIKDIIRRIDKPEEMAEVNRLLALKGYPPTDKYSAIENYIYQEANNSIVHTYNSSDYLEQTVQEWINNGTLKGQAANEAQARMAARVLYDGGDGFGTDPEKIKKAVRMIKCPKPTGNREADNQQAREVYRLVNNMIKKHNTFYGLGIASTDLLDYCRGELWESEVKYLNGILAETNAIKGQEKAQAVSDLTEEAVSGAGTDIEYLEQAIKGIDSPEDRKAVEAKLKEYCEKKGIKPQIAGQAYLQAILYDECDTFMGISTDHKEIRKFNEMLISQGAYTEEEIVNLRAEQAALQILEGNFDNVKDAIAQIKDRKVLAKLEQLLKTKGYKSLDDFLSRKLSSTKSDLINAELASNNLLANEKAADVAYRLMKNSDFDNRAMGVRAIRNETVAKMVDEKLKKDGSSLAKFMEQFNKEKANYKSKADFWDGFGKLLNPITAEAISDAYRENTDSSDNMFVEMQQPQTLTPEQKAAYQMTVKLMEQKLAQMEKDYKAALDSQGVLSGAINNFSEFFGVGTTKEEIQARIEHDRETIRLLKLAADGKLGKMENGKTVAVSFEEVFKERNIDTNFDIKKVEKVQKQAEMLVAMDYAKTNIAICWQEIDDGLNSRDTKRLTIAILDTLDKLSTMSSCKLSLDTYGYRVKNGMIFDSANNPVSSQKLVELASTLKQGLTDVANLLLGQQIPLNTSSSKINEVLEDAYNAKKESFKQEFKDAFGQNAPDELIDNYISTINTGKMVVNFGAIIGATIAAPFTGGGSLAVFVAVAGTSFGLNALEKSTDANGYTNSEWTSDAEQALWDGALAAVGMKVGKYAEGFAQGTKVDSVLLKNLLSKNTKMLSKAVKDPKALQSAAETITRIEANGYKITLQMAEKMNPKNTQLVSKFIKNPEHYKTAMIWVARVEAAGIEVTSDTLQSFLQMYCQEGQFDEASFITGLIMSVGGNVLGHTVGAANDLKGTKSIHDGVSNKKKVDNAKANDGAKSENADGSVKSEFAAESALPKAKTYSEMNENELFAEYQRLDNELKNSNASQSEKYPMLKEWAKIKSELKNRGFSIEGDNLVSNKKKVDNAKVNDGAKSENADGSVKSEFTAESALPKAKTYSEMNENELFTEYQRLHQETLYAPLDNKIKADNIKKMRQIEKELELKGFIIDATGKLQNKITYINHKNTDKKANVHNNPKVENKKIKKQLDNKKEVSTQKQDNILDDSAKGISSKGSKLTKKQVNLYNKILGAIDSLTDLKHYNKIAKTINKYFADIKDVFDKLWDKLYVKAQQYDLDLETNLIKKKVKTPYDNLIPKQSQVVKSVANYHKADIVDVNVAPKKFKKGDCFVLDLATNKHAQISLGSIMSIDLSEPRLAELLMNLKEGESFTIGSFEGHATYKFGSSANGVSHEHLIVTKQNGVYVFKDTSTFGTHISKNSAEPIKAKDVKSMFFGNHTNGSYYMSKVHNGSINLTSEDYKNIAKLINKCDGKYRKLWESTFLLDKGRNIDKLAAFENLIKKHGTFDYYLNLDDKTWAVVVENICQKHETAVEAISNYKASSKAINESLSNHYAYSAHIAQYINDMTNYLNTQTINKHIKVYRGEQYNGSLSLLKFPNGMSVGQAMENLIKKGASQQEIDSFVNKYLIGTKFKQDRFMSTALNKKFCEEWAKNNTMGKTGPNPNGSVVWEIDVPGETKGAFIEDFNVFYDEEYEILLQRESSLIIKWAYFDPKENQWIIQAKVTQIPYNQIQKYK